MKIEGKIGQHYLIKMNQSELELLVAASNECEDREEKIRAINSALGKFGEVVINIPTAYKYFLYGFNEKFIEKIRKEIAVVDVGLQNLREMAKDHEYQAKFGEPPITL